MLPVILCGGAGRRLWPLSRPDRPKPLLAIGGEPLLAATARRFAGGDFHAPWLVAGRDHAQAMAAAAPEASRVLVEPVARGTALAVAASAALACEQDPDALLLITPADHVVREAAALRAAVLRAREAACRGRVVTFGITPVRAATEYGWITPGAPAEEDSAVRTIARFVEKPALARAEQLLSEGIHLWNAGMFLFRAESLLVEILRHAPDVHEAALSAVQHARREDRQVLLAEAPLTPLRSQSFDVALMEKTERAAVLPISCGWSDVGTWSAVRALQPGGSGPVTQEDSPGTFAWSDGPHLAVLGAPDLVVVATAGAVLVASLERASATGDLPPPVDVLLDRGAAHEVRRIFVAAGDALSVPAGSRALVLEGSLGPGAGKGAVLEAGRYPAEGGCTVLLVRWG